MADEREQFISEEDNELEQIRQKKLQEIMKCKERKQEMSAEPVHVTDSNFNETVSKHSFALIDFYASWCGPCQALAPTIKEMAGKYSGKVLVGKLDIDENPETATRFQVLSVPTLVIMKNGKEVQRIVGLVPKTHIEAALRRHSGE
jgi:thioredoxin 1